MRRLLPLLCVACGAAPTRPSLPATVTISIVGTNDLHGHILGDKGSGGVALLGGYVANLRAHRAATGGAVLLIDGGDLFQGTLESNLGEGAAVIAAYNVLGYDAAAAGNHELDFGPVGAAVVPRAGSSDDPRGALRARAAEARFPILVANLIEESTGQPLRGPGFASSVMREVAGVRVGIVGVITADTPTSTIAGNFVGLRIRPLAETLDEETRRLRAAGAELIVVAAHAGLCQRVSDSVVLEECDFGEMLDAVRALEEPDYGGIDVVVAGHTHAGVTRREGRVAITEAWKYGRAFGRVDVVYDRVKKRVVSTEIMTPHLMVEGESYEGAKVVPDAKVAAAIAPAVAAASELRARSLGVRVETPMPASYEAESPLGNLVVDLMLQARPKADLAVSNGGGLRRGWEPGELTYGVLFETYPFDNRFATVTLSGADLRQIFSANARSAKGILNVAGLRVTATCKGEGIAVSLRRPDGREVRDDERLTMVTSDFLATGGMDGALPSLPGVYVEESGTVRDELATVLQKRGGTLRSEDKALFDPSNARFATARRPLVCAPK